MSMDSTLENVVENMNKSSLKIALVVNKDNQLEGTISDGDIRRGLLKGMDLKSHIKGIIYKDPLVAPPGLERSVVLQVMRANKVQQIPIVDKNNKILGLHVWDQVAAPLERQNMMIIMAGGKGVRLLPITKDRPKPLIEVGGKPMLEHIIMRAKNDGFTWFLIAINYLGNLIEDYFGDGSRFGVKIDYIREEKPLGTAGALSLLYAQPEKPFIVSNGDVITDVSYGDLLDFHEHHKAIATMAVRSHEWQHPFGVVRTDGVDIIGFDEKPVNRTNINAGIYVLSPEALDDIKKDEPLDMPTLFNDLHKQSKRTVAYPMHEPWLDLGRPDDLIKAHSELSFDN